ncbi:uncharacterized protein LOC100518053 isoform X9 [Sus scrofa]|uniref:uncharacterized protein LOC100518053 isoform X9 n=1 Tax=Sus scrofa TaxID=9823 RepID=UPI000A2B4A71|nr:uncharacterized protein LOC100518053 isoform X9 [Sus scrofa]
MCVYLQCVCVGVCGCVWVCICALIGLFSCINLAFNLNVLLISHDIYIDLSILISEQHQREYEETEGPEKSLAERRKLFEKPQGKKAKGEQNNDEHQKKDDVPEKIFVPQERNVTNKREEEKEREEIMRKSQGIPVSEQHQREYEETEGPEKSLGYSLNRREQSSAIVDDLQGKNDVLQKKYGKTSFMPLHPPNTVEHLRSWCCKDIPAFNQRVTTGLPSPRSLPF